MSTPVNKNAIPPPEKMPGCLVIIIAIGLLLSLYGVLTGTYHPRRRFLRPRMRSQVEAFVRNHCEESGGGTTAG